MIQPRCGIKCGGFYACFFVQRVARYGSVIPYCSVHLDARPNQPRHEIKCGDFWTYFLRQRLINRQERYSFRATSCTLRRDFHTELEPHKPLFLLHFNLFNASRTLSGAIFSLCCCTKFLTQSGWVLPYSRNAQPMALLMKNSD